MSGDSTLNTDLEKGHSNTVGLQRFRFGITTLAMLGCMSVLAVRPCAADDSLTGLYAQHPVYQAALRSQLAADDAARENEAWQVGRQRIAAGRALTSFVPVPGGLAPDAYAAQQTDAAQRQVAARLYRVALRTFQETAARLHVDANDVAEARALAFSMAYEVYSGGVHVNAQQRSIYAAQSHSALMADAIFQGMSDERRQRQTEKFAIDAVLAAAEYESAVAGHDAALRERAVQIAAQTLKDLWTGPPETLELTSTGFGDRGDRIIRAGAASTRLPASHAPGSTDVRTLQLWAEFERYAKANGVPVDDFGQVRALAFSINYEVYAGKKLNAKQFAWVLQMMSHDLMRDATFQGSTDGDKQRMAETVGAGAFAAYTDLQRAGKGSPEADRARQAAKRNVDELFLPRKFDAYVLEEDGFRSRY